MVLNGKKMILSLFILSVAALVLAFGVAVINITHLGSGVVGLIYIDDVIGAESTSSFLSGPRQTFLSQLRSAKHDPQIQALVLRINSPGGTSGTSQELYNTILSIRNQGIPVVVSMGDIATSGGYYIAAAADYIYANGSTLTGSIGVIIEFTSYQELYEKIGIEVQVVKSGIFKDAGNRSRTLTPVEEELFQALIYDSWDQFVADVAKGRGLERTMLEPIADGRILTGRQALELQLIDELGGLDEALKKAQQLADIPGDIPIRTYQTPRSFLDRVLASSLRIINTISIMHQFPVQLKYQL